MRRRELVVHAGASNEVEVVASPVEGRALIVNGGAEAARVVDGVRIELDERMQPAVTQLDALALGQKGTGADVTAAEEDFLRLRGRRGDEDRDPQDTGAERSPDRCFVVRAGHGFSDAVPNT